MNSSHNTSATKAKDHPLHPLPPLSFEETIAGYEAVHSKPFETLINEVLQDNYIALEQFRERIADKKSHFPEKLAAWANKKLAEQKDGVQELAFTAVENYLIAISFLTPISDLNSQIKKAIPYIEKMIEQGHVFGIHALLHLSNKKPENFKTLIEKKPQKSLSDIMYLARNETDYEKRLNLYQLAFEMGSEEAAHYLGREYLWPTPAAKYYLTVRAQRGSTDTLLFLSRFDDHPDGIKYTRYLTYTVGSAAATYDLANIHKDRGEFMEAAELFLRVHILNPNTFSTSGLSEIIKTKASQNPTLFYFGWLVDIVFHDDGIFITQLTTHTDVILECWVNHLNSDNNQYEKMRQEKAVTKMEPLLAKSTLSQNQPQLLNTIKAKLACYFARTNLAKAFTYFDEVDPAKLSVKEREAFALELYGFSFRLQQSMKNKAMQAAQLSDCVALQARIASGSTRGLHLAPTQPPQVMSTAPEQKHQHMLFSAKSAAAAPITAPAVDKDLDTVFKSLHNTFLTIYLPLFQRASAFANLGEFKETLIRKLMSMDREFSRLATSLMPDEADLAGLKSIIEHCKAEIDALPSFPNEIIESHQPLKEYFSHTLPDAFKTLLDELTEVLKPKINAPAAAQAPR